MATLDDLRDALDDAESESTVTSVRQPASLRRALQVAVELGMAPSNNEAMNETIRGAIEAFAMQRALEEHYEAHPSVRPTLEEVAHALAVLDRNPLAEQPELLAQAAREVQEVKPLASADDVLLWAASLLRHAAA